MIRRSGSTLITDWPTIVGINYCITVCAVVGTVLMYSNGIIAERAEIFQVLSSPHLVGHTSHNQGYPDNMWCPLSYSVVS